MLGPLRELLPSCCHPTPPSLHSPTHSSFANPFLLYSHSTYYIYPLLLYCYSTTGHWPLTISIPIPILSPSRTALPVPLPDPSPVSLISSRLTSPVCSSTHLPLPLPSLHPNSSPPHRMNHVATRPQQAAPKNLRPRRAIDTPAKQAPWLDSAAMATRFGNYHGACHQPLP